MAPDARFRNFKPVIGSRRRTGAVVGAIVAVVLAACGGTPKPHALTPVPPVAAAEQTAVTGTLDAGPVSLSTPTSSVDAPPVEVASPNRTPGAGVPEPPGQPADTASTPTDPGATTSTAPPSGPDECVARGGETGADGPVGGVGAGDYPHCDYTATSPAGYATNATSWEIKATHPDGTTDYWSTFTTPNDPPCAPVGTIRSGDRVSIHLLNGSDGKALGYYLAVGPNHHC